MSKYAMLDQQIIKAVRKKPLSFAMLQAREDIGGLADSLAPKNKYGDAMGWRLIDRRLQALRKSARIAHRNGYWGPSGSEK